jgi:hypothetical protein
MSPDEMRVRVRQYRALARVIDDAQAYKALHDLADEYEAIAERTELPSKEGSQEE